MIKMGRNPLKYSLMGTRVSAIVPATPRVISVIAAAVLATNTKTINPTVSTNLMRGSNRWIADFPGKNEAGSTCYDE